MALSGNLELSSGVVPKYHHIQAFTWKKDLSLNILIASYVDEASRLANKETVSTKNFSFPNTPSNFDFSMSNLYLKIKEVAAFSAMLDV